MSKQPKHYISDIPELMKEWDWEKNNELGFDPNMITYGSGKKVWWKCKRGHEWLATINSRNRHKNCPYCSGRNVIQGINDLATVYPEIARQWHPTKNGDLKPTDVKYGSRKKVWWQCEYGHEWQATIANRSSLQRGCPQCNTHGVSLAEMTVFYYINKYSNCQVIHHYRQLGFEIDIFIPNYNIAIEYDSAYYHNNRIKNDLIKNRLCADQHIILIRLREKGLPLLNDTSIDIECDTSNNVYFSNVISNLIDTIFKTKPDINVLNDNIHIYSLMGQIRKINSIVETHPILLTEWHPTKNLNISPMSLTHGSNQKIWWQCSECGYEWQARVGHRTAGHGCPICAHQRFIEGGKKTRFIKGQAPHNKTQ